ncbi:MAG: hypothetical protein PHZ11_01370 [Desulfitobacteriaceae bacterium]|nr:hypothetical protein [Desulfitobacteriaceae bacterium]MDD4345544.1 hypothetical protein [Desulfitobacteriaceae bacterium]MDD4401647.1 hypothetical protein [Desulfitobacteriaceae bacterium]
MRAFIQRLLKAAGKYTITDYAFFKATLISLGILLGAYFAQFFLNHAFFLWAVFIVSYLWIMYRTLITHRN